jgi:septal ring-binding cell division protein DamX
LAALVIALAGVTFVYRDELPALMGSGSEKASVEPPAAPAGGVELADSSFEHLPGAKPVEDAMFFDSAGDDFTGAAAAESGDPADEVVLPEDTDPMLLPDSEPDIAVTDGQGDEPPAASVASFTEADSVAPDDEQVPMVEEQSGEAVSSTTDGLPRREGWLLAQAPDAWTVQLFASREERLLALIEEHQLEAEAAVFKVRGGDPPLYALVWGSFATRAEANQALEGDLARIPGIKPWVRSLGDIQAVIAAQGGGSR